MVTQALSADGVDVGRRSVVRGVLLDEEQDLLPGAYSISFRIIRPIFRKSVS